MANIEMESKEISVVLDACGELLDKTKDKIPLEHKTLKEIIAKIRDNGDVAKDLREYAKEILEGI